MADDSATLKAKAIIRGETVTPKVALDLVKQLHRQVSRAVRSTIGTRSP
jgi:hypothetical protein